MRILVGVDGSSQALGAVEWVSRLPLRASDEIVMACVVEQSTVLGAWGYFEARAAQLMEETTRYLQEGAREAVDSAAAKLTGCPAGVRTFVRHGHPVEELGCLAREVEADLIAVGSRGRGRLEALLLGSVTLGLLDMMPLSILVVRGVLRVPLRVILAVDGSAHGVRAARCVAALPLPGETRIQVLLCVAGKTAPRHAAAPDGHALSELERRQATTALDQVLEILNAAGRSGDPVLREGDPKREIVAAAQELGSDLVVLGARGRGGFARMVLGSVSRAVVLAAPCSTLVVAPAGG